MACRLHARNYSFHSMTFLQLLAPDPERLPPSSVLLNATQLLRFYYHPETAKNPIEFLQKIVTFNRNIKI